MSRYGMPVIREIRRRLITLCNSRERAYREARSHGQPVPKYRIKKEAIERIRIQLQASDQWTLEQHIKMVHGLSEMIEAIIPDYLSRFHGLRRQVIDMVTWCEGQFQQRNLNQAA